MEHKVESSNGTQAPKKARCLAVKSLYKAGSSKEDPKRLQSKNLKRKNSSDEGGDENKKKRSRKEVSLSSLKKRKEKRLSDVTNAGAHFCSPDSSESKPEVDERPSSNGNLNGIGLSLDDDVLKIPKRKRGTSGRKKFEHTQELNPAEPSVSRLDFAGPSGKLMDGDPERGSGNGKVKIEDAFDDLKENGHSVGGPLQEQDCLVRSSETSNGKSKKLVKNRRKQREVKPGGVRSAVLEAGSAVNVSAKRCDDQQEDDEENLEENAARMLSSRFDPSCTGFSSKSRASPSPSPSPNSLFFLLSSNGKFLDQGSTSHASPNSASVKAANRALRPRNQHGEKLRSRKRRHFYEIPSEQVDVYWVLNKRIKVFWPLDECWYHGLVNDYDGEKKLHHIKYDDRDEEWIDLQKERIKLLLLPIEARTKFAVGSRKRSVEPTEEEEERPLTSANDGCSGSYMDTEPIISWLARSSRGVKSSSSSAVKKRILGPSLKMKRSSSAVDAVDTCGAATAGSFLKGGQMAIHGDCVSTGGPFRAGNAEKVAKSSRSLKGGRAPIVYYRKRFRRAAEALYERVEDDAFSLGKSDSNGSLLTIEETGFLKLIYLARRESNDFMVSSLLRPFRVENSQLVYDLVLLYYGGLVTMWPVVKLEMLFVDSIVGLRLILFEGCLGNAVAFAISVLNLLSESNGEVKLASLQSPITSVRFKFSRTQGCENQLVFGFYNFLRLQRSKRLCLESILRENCLLVEKLSPSECTYNTVQNGDIQLLPQAALDSSLEGLQKMTSEGMWPSGVSNGDVNSGNSSGSDTEFMKLPLFALPFTSAPTFFLSLHLKLLMYYSVSKISFVELNQEKSAENASILAQSNIGIDDCSMNDLGFDTNREALSRESPCGNREAKDDQAVELVVCKGSDLRTPQDNQSGNLQTGRIQSGTENLAVDGDEVGQLWEGEENHEKPEKKSSPLNGERIASGACPLNGIKVDIPHHDGVKKPVDDGSQHDLPPTDMAWDMNGSLVPSPNPTAPRSVWHRSRSSSLYGYFSRGWSDAKSDGSLNSFGNGPKKPRTHVTYSYPSGVSGSSSKPHQRTVPHKRIRRPNEKRSSDVSRVSQRNWESLSCQANLLITVGDRGWRESGAEVVLELVENEWNLAAKVSGTTKYSHKPHQFLQPGSANRYTHAMMWRGGKEWTLEFSDRSQWALFKEMHEECYNRNFRAASIKNIPIPGVRLVEDYDDNGMELLFRSSAIYFQQVETDTEMALNPSRVLYDMESDDEQWISSCQSSSDVHDNGCRNISVEVFERTMDMFEKKAHALQRDHFTSEEIDDLKLVAGPVVRGIYEHWRQKRQKKGMPLIRHLQPPLWEKYEQQLREWELTLNKGTSAASDGCQKASAAERPPMFAFCMKPRGLEVPNKGSKQRSQKRFSVTGQSNGFHGDQDGFHSFGRRLNGPSFGDDKALYLGHNYGHVDNSQLAQASPLGYSPRDVPGQGYFPIGNEGFNRNYPPRLHRYKSKKSSAVASPRHSQMVTAYNRGITGSKKNTLHWNSHQQFSAEGSHRPSSEQWDQVDMDEYKLVDASGAARYASNLAKLKRERAQRLLCKADVAVHRAVVALMTAEAMKASSEDGKDDG